MAYDTRVQDVIPFRLGDWTVEPLLNRLSRGERVVTLEPKVMRLLVCLADRRGQVVTRQTLLTQVWDGLSVVDGVMGRAVYQLRRRLAECDGCGADVETIRQVGFRLVCVETRAAPVRRLGRLAGHPVLAWGMTGVAAAVALTLTVNEMTETPLVRFVTVQVPTAAAPQKEGEAEATPARSIRPVRATANAVPVVPLASEVGSTDNSTSMLNLKEARAAVLRAEREANLANLREARLQAMAERRFHNVSFAAPPPPPAPPAPPPPAPPAAPAPPAPPAPPTPPSPRSAPVAGTVMIIS